jgi:hypothetical protein
MGASRHPPSALSLDRPPQLRLRGGVDEPSIIAEDGDASATALLRESRRAILESFGPCCAGSLPLLRAWALRLAETRPMSLARRQALLAELQTLLG